MACNKPLIRLANLSPIEFGEKSKTIKILKYDEIESYEYFEKRNEEFRKNNEPYEYQKIPCGKCWACRLSYSKDWATRCTLESKEFEENWFITLTYDDEHKPYINKMSNKETGEIYEDDGTWNGYLVPEHVTKFMKDLRRHWYYHENEHTNIRFFSCGEYGEKYKRPHYHLILFNLPIKPEDIKVWKNTKDGNTLYKCPKIEQIWKKGAVVLANVNWSTCAYVARYVTKKITGEIKEDHYASKGQTQEFVRMSRKPGIGRNFYEQNKEKIYQNDEIIMKTVKGNIGAIKPPKYYDKIYDIDYPEDMEKIKERRKNAAIENQKVKARMTTLSEKEQLIIQEKTLANKAALLKRSMNE